MMNIRDYFPINKTKNPNKIKILDLLGFEADIAIDTSEYQIENIEDSDNLDQQSFDELISNTEEIISTPVQSTIETYLDSDQNTNDNSLATSTDTFNPMKITSQIQKVWSDLESRRKWVFPTFIGVVLLVVISISISSFLNYRNVQTEIAEDAIVVTSNSNELIDLLPTLIEISSNTFYSKYDVSNASANLQQIESSLIEYRTNLDSRSDILDLSLIHI